MQTLNSKTKYLQDNSLPRIKSQLIDSGGYADFTILHIGYVMYSLSDAALTIDEVSGTRFLATVIGTNENKVNYSSLGGNIMRITNNQSWPIRFIILN